ncbi:hypothetical protein G9A89_003361 [Geosiphon pyriformis]|nr:hypothetical protein G9A89_003361 [Geosiphon pyriformis]
MATPPPPPQKPSPTSNPLVVAATTAEIPPEAPPKGPPKGPPTNPHITINVPKEEPRRRIFGGINRLRKNYDGEAVKSGLNALEKFGIKDNIEDAISKIDPDTPAERILEERRITHRIYKIDLAITYLLYYTSLALNWLTLLGQSNSFGDFLYEVFIGSLDFTEWNFYNYNIIGKISGATCSLQILFFVLANFIVLGMTFIHPNGIKSLPENLRGPIFYGGPFQLINLLKPTLEKYNLSVQRLDAQFSECIGILSQLFIMVACSLATNIKMNDLSTFINSNPDAIGPSELNTGLNYLVARQLNPNNTQPIQSQDATQLALSAQHAALFTKTTLIVSTVAITMTAFLNILSWISNIWRINQSQLIIYEIYKGFTRLLICQPCCGEKLVDDDNDVSEGQAKAEQQALMGQEKPEMTQEPHPPPEKQGNGKNGTSLKTPTNKSPEQKPLKDSEIQPLQLEDSIPKVIQEKIPEAVKDAAKMIKSSNPGANS